MRREKITVVIPSYNEEGTIGDVVENAQRYADEVLVVDDGSNDKTAEIAVRMGAKVVSHKRNMGYLEALRSGFRHSNGQVIVTLDADGQHRPDDIPRLVKPILSKKLDLVIGARENQTFSERVITWLTNFRVKISDATSGFRALRRDLALKMELKGKCTCGTFLLEAKTLGARIGEVKITTNERKFGRSRIKKKHFAQVLIVLKELFANRDMT